MPLQLLWLTIGGLALVCGIAGVVLPLVPATPFLLVAAFAFARSSPTLHDWLLSHPCLGPPIQDWNAHGAISRPAKISASIVMMLALAGSCAVGVSWTVILVQLAVLAIVAAFIMWRQDAPGEGI